MAFLLHNRKVPRQILQSDEGLARYLSKPIFQETSMQ